MNQLTEIKLLEFIHKSKARHLNLNNLMRDHYQENPNMIKDKDWTKIINHLQDTAHEIKKQA